MPARTRCTYAGRQAGRHVQTHTRTVVLWGVGGGRGGAAAAGRWGAMGYGPERFWVLYMQGACTSGGLTHRQQRMRLATHERISSARVCSGGSWNTKTWTARLDHTFCHYVAVGFRMKIYARWRHLSFLPIFTPPVAIQSRKRVQLRDAVMMLSCTASLFIIYRVAWGNFLVVD